MLLRILGFLLRRLYGFRAFNTAALEVPGPVLLVANHVSWWDWIFIGVCLQKDWRIVTSSTTAALSWLHQRIMVNRRTFPVDMNSPYAIKHMAEYLQKGGRLMLFPEGRISCTGSLMKLFDGTGFLIAKTRPKVITAYIRGAHRLPFSHNPDRKQWFPRVSVHFSEPLAPPPHPDHHGATETRTRLTDWLRREMIRQRFETEMEFGPGTVPGAILQTASRLPRHVIVQDTTMQGLTYGRLLAGSSLLARQWRQRLDMSEKPVGVLLPNVNAMPVVLLSVWLANRVPAVLNFTHGPAILVSCARLARLKHIITSRSFVSRAGIDLKPLEAAGIQIIFLEDVRAAISSLARAFAALHALLHIPGEAPASVPEDTAVILFTSGSEGEPKGVELSHRNVMSNIRQMLSVVDLMDHDRFFNALPLFHCFGLTVGLLLPLITGSYIFLYVSPLHYRVVPSAFYNLDCTVFFGTNTVLAGYARKAHPYDFRTLRYVFAGAEKLQESTSAIWMRNFGVRILEGYGATECSPCLSVNVPLHPREGSAGQFLPGIEHRLEAVAGIEAGVIATGLRPSSDVSASETQAPPSQHTTPTPHTEPEKVGRLFVRGPNIMRGYLNPEANAAFQALNGWYDTGDIVRIDTDGFLHILGRLKRFAKVGGEMVSLTAVEDALAGAFPQYGLKFVAAVVARPDEIKGERLVAVTNESRLTLAEIRDAVLDRGLGNLAVPRNIKLLHELPRLGTGKVDHRQLETMV